MERSATDLDDCCARFLAIGLGLLYLGKGEACEAIVEALNVVEHPIKKLTEVIVQVRFFALFPCFLNESPDLRFCRDRQCSSGAKVPEYRRGTFGKGGRE
jgi:26S proteasome regulatory subunit N1